MTLLKVERMGGFAGFGTTNSKIKSIGEIDTDQLPAHEKQSIDDLFKKKNIVNTPQQPDTFLYKISRTTSQGFESVEAQEHLVPNSVKNSVRDEFA